MTREYQTSIGVVLTDKNGKITECSESELIGMTIYAAHNDGELDMEKDPETGDYPYRILS